MAASHSVNYDKFDFVNRLSSQVVILNRVGDTITP